MSVKETTVGFTLVTVLPVLWLGQGNMLVSSHVVLLDPLCIYSLHRPIPSSIVIVNSKLLKRHSKAKRRAPAYSRALRQIRGVFQRIVRGRLRSVFQIVRECVKSEVFSKE